MYNLSDYIILCKSAYLVNHMALVSISDNYSDEETNKYDYLLRIDTNIKNLFQTLFTGTEVEKYIVSRYEEADIKKFIPFTLLKISQLDLIVPVFVSDYAVYAINPYPREEVPMVTELFSLNQISHIEGPIAMSEFLTAEDNSYFVEMLTGRLNAYKGTVGDITNKIYKNYDNVEEFNILPMDLSDTMDSKVSFVKNNHIIETSNIDESDIYVPEVPMEMFMPLVVKGEAGNSSSYLTLVTSEDDKKLISRFNKVSTSEDINSKMNGTFDKVVVNAPEGCEFIVVEMGSTIYTGHGILTSVILKGDSIDETTVEYLDLKELTLFSGDVLEKEPFIMQAELNGATSTEGFKEIAEEAGKYSREIMIIIGPMARKLFGLPKDILSLLYKWLKKLINSVNSLEQNMALNFQEKVINDEVTETTELIYKLISNLVVLGISFMIPIGFVLQMFVFFFLKKVNNELRVNAIERVEHRLEDAMIRLDKKIEFAQQDYKKEDVNELMKQRAMYLFAINRLLEIKKKVYGKEQKPSLFKKREED